MLNENERTAAAEFLNKKLTNWCGSTTKIPSKAVGGGIFHCFSNFNKCQPKEAVDDISGVAED